MLTPGRAAGRDRRAPAGCGAARSTPWPTGCCGSTAPRSGCAPASPCSTRATPPTCSASSATTSGWASSGRRFPKKDTLASIYSRVVNAQEPLADVVERDFPWCRDDVDGIKDVFAGYIDAQARPQRRRLRRPAALLAGAGHVARRSARCCGGLRPRPGRRVPGHQRRAGRHRRRHGRARRQRGRGRRRRPGDLRLPVRARPAHGRVPRARSPAPPSSRSTATTGRRRPILASGQRGHARGRAAASPRSCGRRGPRATVRCWRRAPTSWPSRPSCATSVLEHRERGVPLHDQAVLFRTGHHSDGLELELARRNIPFVKYGGLKFLEAAHVKDLLCLLRVLENPSDELAWHRVLGLLEGVGPATIRRLVDELGVADADALAGCSATTAPDSRAAAAERPAPASRPRCGDCTTPTTRRRRSQIERLAGLRPDLRPPLPGHRRGAPGRPRAAARHGRRVHDAAAGSSPSSPSTRRRPPATWPARPISTTTSSCSPRSTRPRAASGRWCT